MENRITLQLNETKTNFDNILITKCILDQEIFDYLRQGHRQ